MKKVILFFIILSLSVTGCRNKQNFLRLPNDCMSENFQNSVDMIYREEEDLVNINIASFDKAISPLKMISIQNLYGVHNMEFTDKEERNKYRYSIEKSIYENKNYVLLEELKNSSCEEDFFEAYYAAERINDIDLKEKIDNKYDEYNGSKYEAINEKIYCYINHLYRTGKEAAENEEIKRNVYEIIEEEVESNESGISMDSLFATKAALAYLYICKDNSQNQKLEKIYQRYNNKQSQIYNILDVDICVEDYTYILFYLRKLLSINKEEGDFFYEQAQKGEKLYQQMVYDVTGAQNFALYLLAIAYVDKKVSNGQYDTLLQIYNQILTETAEDDYQGQYYLKFAATLLNINPSNITCEAGEGDYYYYLYTGKRKNRKELYDDPENIQEQLYLIECSEKSKEQAEVLQNISILEYEEEEDFAVLLNLYIVNMKKNDCLSKDIKSSIYNYIKNQECDLGYKIYGGGYDFRTSVYYTNVLYILDGGEDIGFR